MVRLAAITFVILLHASVAPYSSTIDPNYMVNWFAWNAFNAFAWVGVPLFVLVSGALLLKPSKADEPLGVFFKKRWVKIGLPILFWGAAYFAWNILVNHSALTGSFVLSSILSGPYFHFWYVYMLIGLYLATPILRVLVANMTRQVFGYLMILWFVSLIAMPILHIYGQTGFDYFFVFSGFLGCYLFGAYLRDVKLRSSLLYGLLAVGVGWSILGNWFVTATLGEKFNYFILGNLTINMIVTAAALFLILTKITYTNRLFSFIGKNTLTIYLFHIMIIEAFQNGYFGFTLNGTTLGFLPLEIPVITAATLLLCVLIVMPMKKVPILNRFTG